MIKEVRGKQVFLHLSPLLMVPAQEMTQDVRLLDCNALNIHFGSKPGQEVRAHVDALFVIYIM